MAKVPRRPMYGSSTAHPARNAPGMPMTLSMNCCKTITIGGKTKRETLYVSISDGERPISVICSAACQPRSECVNEESCGTEDIVQVWKETVIEGRGQPNNSWQS